MNVNVSVTWTGRGTEKTGVMAVILAMGVKSVTRNVLQPWIVGSEKGIARENEIENGRRNGHARGTETVNAGNALAGKAIKIT